MAPKTDEQITERTQAATSDYFGWLQNAISASPWANTELNSKLLSYASETATAYVEFTQRLSRAKNFEDAAKIQTEFVKEQVESFNNRAKELGEIYTKMVSAAATRPFGMST
ncbi:MAG TPA: phasin family protein [Xanthobacteraceae bacterium]|nr:phasin family protein [Xanthobacteraceae bacterium]